MDRASMKCEKTIPCEHCSNFSDISRSCSLGLIRYELPAAPATSAFGRQEGGSHYTDCAIQPFEYSMANKLDPMQHTAVKYVTRFRSKGGIADLRKAIHTIELLIEWEEKNAQKHEAK